MGIVIAQEYTNFNTDSALIYYNYVVAHGDSVMAARAKLGLALVFTIQGTFQESQSLLEEVEHSSKRGQIETEYLDIMQKYYSYLSAYAGSTDGAEKEKYSAEERRYRSLYIGKLEPGSPEHTLYISYEYIAKGNSDDAAMLLEQLIKELPPTNSFYARAAAALGGIHNRAGDMETAAHYYCMASISDIKGANKEYTSLRSVAEILYLKGDPVRAHQYLSRALNDAVACSSWVRTVEISVLLTKVDGAYRTFTNHSRDLLVITICLMLVLAIGLVGAMVSIFRDKKKLVNANFKLQQANELKEEYISSFLHLCSIYMDRLDTFCTTVARKIKAGKHEDLLRLSQSTKFSEDQHKIFHDNFDAAFLHIYPNFVKEFNDLLLPEERIELRDEGHLNAELRIFALLRMGIDAPTKIANFLHLRVNTIYAYRNKVRNKAIDRDNFDQHIKHIGSI